MTAIDGAVTITIALVACGLLFLGLAALRRVLTKGLGSAARGLAGAIGRTVAAGRGVRPDRSPPTDWDEPVLRARDGGLVLTRGRDPVKADVFRLTPPVAGVPEVPAEGATASLTGDERLLVVQSPEEVFVFDRVGGHGLRLNLRGGGLSAAPGESEVTVRVRSNPGRSRGARIPDADYPVASRPEGLAVAEGWPGGAVAYPLAPDAAYDPEYVVAKTRDGRFVVRGRTGDEYRMGWSFASFELSRPVAGIGRVEDTRHGFAWLSPDERLLVIHDQYEVLILDLARDVGIRLSQPKGSLTVEFEGGAVIVRHNDIRAECLAAFTVSADAGDGFSVSPAWPWEVERLPTVLLPAAAGPAANDGHEAARDDAAS